MRVCLAECELMRLNGRGVWLYECAGELVN